MTITTRADTVTELLRRRDELMLSNTEWAVLTKAADPRGRGVSYQTIRRMENDARIPRPITLRILKAALDREEESRVSTAA